MIMCHEVNQERDLSTLPQKRDRAHPKVGSLQTRSTLLISMMVALGSFWLGGGCEHSLEADWDDLCQPPVMGGDPAQNIWVINDMTENIAGLWRLKITDLSYDCPSPYLGDEILSAPLLFDTDDGFVWWYQSGDQSSDDSMEPTPVGNWGLNLPLILEIPMNLQDEGRAIVKRVQLIVKSVTAIELTGEARLYVKDQDTTEGESQLLFAHRGSFSMERIPRELSVE